LSSRFAAVNRHRNQRLRLYRETLHERHALASMAMATMSAFPGASILIGVDSPIKGTDFAMLKDGHIRSITGFLDQIPPGARA
jgi:hypothetical protein